MCWYSQGREVPSWRLPQRKGGGGGGERTNIVPLVTALSEGMLTDTPVNTKWASMEPQSQLCNFLKIKYCYG